MSYDIGPKIGIEGEAEFKSALKDINTNLKTMGTEMKAVTSAYEKGDKSAGALTAQNQVLNKQIDEQRGKLDLLKAKLAESAAQYGENDAKTQKWQQSVNLATADLNKMDRQLVENKTALEGGDKAQDKMVASTDKLSTAQDRLKTGLKAAGIAAAAVGVAFAAMANAALGNADELQRQADVTGLTAERLQELQYAGNNLGVELETITGAQAKLTKSMFAAKDGTGAQADAFAALGISVVDSNGQLKDSKSIMSEAFTALNGVGNETERDAIAMQLFGKSAMELNPMIKAGGDELNRLTEEARNNGAIMSNEAVAGLDSFGDTMENLKTSVMGTFGEAFADALPKIQSMADKLRELPAWVEENSNKLIALGGAIGTVAATIVAYNIKQALSTAGMTLWTAVTTAATVAATALKAAITFLTGPVGIAIAVIGALVTAGVLLYKNWDTVKAKCAEVWSAISSSVGGAVNKMKVFFSGLLTSIQKLPGEMLNIGKNIVSGIWNGISQSAKWLLDKVKEWCGSILKGIKAFFGIKSPSRVMRDEVGIMLARGVADGIDNGIVYARNASAKLGDAIMSEMSDLNKQLSDMESKEQKDQAEKDLAAHKKSIADKYDELGKAEAKDKQKVLDEIAKLQADWDGKQVIAEKTAAKLALTEKIATLAEFKKEYESALSELEKKQQSMSDKLSDYGKLFESVKGTDGKDLLQLGDLQGEIDKITLYGDALGKLKENGISDSLMGEITSMNIDEALNYTKLLLEKTPEEYDKYMKLWDEKQKAAALIAKKFYTDEFTQLKTEFVDKVPVELSGLKTEMEGIGKNSAIGLADGFWSKKSYIISTFKTVLETALQEAKEAMEIHSPSRKWAEVGEFMAAGLGVGFTSQMRSVASQINASIPTGADTQYTPRMAVADTVNGIAAMSAANGQSAPQTIIVQSILDGRVIAESVINPMRSTLRQRGVTLA